ncbi:Uncharacterised protein [Mycobacterium tuberculosis]|uniref:Uncharacterized protein n=1 Tax=Mycobacterium tuberculosis TaxID=1773 RepID=A0A916LEH7_MYCTX|nr:Uncharacterised protein [Mycobacterium tuberculosis]
MSPRARAGVAEVTCTAAASATSPAESDFEPSPATVRKS